MVDLFERIANFALRHEWGWLIAILLAFTALNRWGKSERRQERLQDSIKHEETLEGRLEWMKKQNEWTDAKHENMKRELEDKFEELHQEWKDTREVLDFVVGKIQDDERLSWDPEEMEKYQKLMDDSDTFDLEPFDV